MTSPAAAPATVGALLRRAAAALAAAGIDGGRLDAQLLLGAVLGRSRLELVAADRDAVDAAGVAAFEGLLARRLAREPISHILGHREFWSLDFQVTGATLAPRPDSETLIEAALDQFKNRPPPRQILDLGTGTGCLLLTLLHEFPTAFGVGVDRSTAAARVAAANARALGLADRAAFVVGHWSTAIAGSFDIVISNPPYIASAEIAALDPEVARHEPRSALDGGSDGLDDYRALWPEMPRLVAAGGVAIFEIGSTQGAAVSRLAAAAGFDRVAVRPDLGGRDRAVVAQMHAPGDKL